VKKPVVLKNTLVEWALSICAAAVGVGLCMFLFRLRGRPYSVYSFNKSAALTGGALVLSAIALGCVFRILAQKWAIRYRRPLGILAVVLAITHAYLSAFYLSDRYDWDYYAQNWEALLYGFLALIGFALLWLTSYSFAHRRMGAMAWKWLQNSVYILLGLALLHFCHLGKPRCWLDWLEHPVGVPPLSLMFFSCMVVIIVIRLLEPLIRGDGIAQKTDT